MTTVYTCADCGKHMEVYDDNESYVERPERLCTKCSANDAAFDRAFGEYELGASRSNAETRP